MNSNQLIVIEELRSNFLNEVNNSNSISTLTTILLNDSLYRNLLDDIDYSGEDDYSSFNDVEMFYLYIHKQRDLNEKKNRSASTKKEYLRDLLLFYKQLMENAHHFELAIEQITGFQLFKHLNHRHIRKYQEWLKDAPLGKSGKPYSVATLNRKTVIIKSFLAFLFNTKYISIPLHEKVLSSSVRSNDRPNKEISSSEVIAILDYFRNNSIVYGILAVLATTGIRVAELCKARVSDIDYFEGDYWLTVIGKGNEERQVLIHSNVLQAIINFRKRRRLDFKVGPGDESPLFTSAKGKAYNYKYLSNFLIRKINAAELDIIRLRKNPITPHTFRHGFALISEEQGVDIRKIQESLHHKDIRTTMIYLNRRQARKNNAAHAWKNSNVIQNI
ncbi:integrase [Neobacillus notoginsengisoli]|uniref:Integrase n=1 Tax=Neobacillus notoginsengisoli TaxID=1578198 RepID=A0A417YQJ5_9BACI|nr:tyrosine-type recombinase/integrase [Neobacillus notoginsengisoli]RHW36063.1 integrase [Neobacillus notoginsengisoli]